MLEKVCRFSEPIIKFIAVLLFAGWVVKQEFMAAVFFGYAIDNFVGSSGERVNRYKIAIIEP